MSENAYVGRKFTTTFRSGELPDDSRMYEIMGLGQKFSRMGLLPKESGGHAGNMSFRNGKGFVITAGGVEKGKLNPSGFVQVLGCDVSEKRVEAQGEREPSSETMMHWLIYERRKDAGAIIHVHDAPVAAKARKLNVKSTSREHPYGTPELAHAVVKALGRRDYVLIKGHGVLAVGKSLWEAGKIIETFHEAAENL